jgi:hypothetical protein
MAADQPAPKRHPVATFDPADREWNTIVLEGLDVVIPLQEDLDCDPLQDDEIRLQNLDGSFEKILNASDPDANPDHDKLVINYNFRKVPAGLYRISVRTGEVWVDVSTELIVSPRGAFFLGKKLSQNPPRASFKGRLEEPEPASEEEDDPWSPELSEYMDLNESFRGF